MVDLRLKFDSENAGPRFRRGSIRHAEIVLRAARGAMEDVKRFGLNEAREDIARSGNFGPRWTTGLKAETTETSDEIVVNFTHDIPYFMVHQRGALIRGRPLLWIPLPGVDPDERGDFFGFSRRGNLLLFKKLGAGNLRPLRVAKESVRIPKRFHVIETIQDVARHQLREFYAARLAQERSRG